MKRFTVVFLFVALLALIVAPTAALAAPRSGASFGGRGGFRSSGGSFSGGRPGYSSGRGYGGGSNIIVMPGMGWGWGLGGFGGGGGFGLGSLMMVGILGVGAVMVMRAMRRGQSSSAAGWTAGDDDDEAGVAPSRSFVYKVQFGLGRSARGIQGRLETFAAEGDTATEAGLSQLLQQTALELMREKESIRYGAAESSGPMSLTNGETKMNALSLTERSRFVVERVRGADGKVRRSETPTVESKDALEYLLVTLIVATRSPLAGCKALTDREQLEAVLAELGGVAPGSVLGLEVIWTPADPGDSLTDTDLMTTYPELRSL